MVALVGCTVAVVATGGAATPVVLAGAQASATGVVAGSAAAGAAGAAGAVATGTATGAAVSSVGASILAGPIGWAVLGATEDQSPGVYTFDCWKPIVHDNSSEPSNGKTLKEIVMDPRIKQVTTKTNNNNPDLPYLVLENIWDEQFCIEYVYLSSGQLAAHAVRN